MLYEENKFIREHLFTVGAICGPMMGHQFHKCNRATCFADSAYDHFPTTYVVPCLDACRLELLLLFIVNDLIMLNQLCFEEPLIDKTARLQCHMVCMCVLVLEI